MFNDIMFMSLLIAFGHMQVASTAHHTPKNQIVWLSGCRHVSTHALIIRVATGHRNCMEVFAQLQASRGTLLQGNANHFHIARFPFPCQARFILECFSGPFFRSFFGYTFWWENGVQGIPPWGSLWAPFLCFVAFFLGYPFLHRF